MKNEEIKTPSQIKLSELGIHGVWERLLNKLRHIQPHYLLVFILISFLFILLLLPHYVWMIILSSLMDHGLLVSLILVFSLITLSFVWTTGQRLDVRIFIYLNKHGQRPLWLDWFMLCFTQIGNGIFAFVIAFILFVNDIRMLAFEIILGTLTLWMVVEIIKLIFGRTRPYIKLKNTRILGTLEKGCSFPSGHTSQTFFIVTLLINYFKFNVLVSIILIAIAFIVGITRIYVGMHYPRDVLGGAILGSAWGTLGVIVQNVISFNII